MPRGKTEESVIEKVRDYKKYFKGLPSWEKGMPKRVNNLTTYAAKMAEKAIVNAPDNYRLHKLKAIEKEAKGKGKGTIPGHVRASVNWNNFKKAQGDNYSMTITDGMKVIVCRLKNNTMGYDSIAYPTDEMHLPQWFKDLPFDDDAMETAVLDKKVTNVIGEMKFDLTRIHETEAMQTFFEF